MAYSMAVWRPNSGGEPRIYLKGSNRDSIYLKSKPDGSLMWGSETTNATGKKKSSHYTKLHKDQAEVFEIMGAFGLRFGEPGEFARAIQMAAENNLAPECEGDEV